MAGSEDPKVYRQAQEKALVAGVNKSTFKTTLATAITASAAKPAAGDAIVNSAKNVFTKTYFTIVNPGDDSTTMTTKRNNIETGLNKADFTAGFKTNMNTNTGTASDSSEAATAETTSDVTKPAAVSTTGATKNAINIEFTGFKDVAAAQAKENFIKAAIANSLGVDPEDVTVKKIDKPSDGGGNVEVQAEVAAHGNTEGEQDKKHTD